MFNTTFNMSLFEWDDDPEQLPLRYAFAYRVLVGEGVNDCRADASEWMELIDPQASPEHSESALQVNHEPIGKALVF